jgi:mono/diheme cytochrome c family protein
MRIPKGVLWVLLAVVIGAASYVVILVRGGLSAKDQPSLLEAAIAHVLRSTSIPSNAKDAKNPFASTPENLTEGLQHFADHCAICHGNDGSGQTEMGPNLYPKAPDMRMAQTQNLTDGDIFFIITNGVRLTGMPAWGGSHDAEDTWKLVLFIRHLPQLSAEEKQEMESMNPPDMNEGNSTTPWIAPDNAREVKNPVSATPDNLAAARQTYQDNCMPCHGEKGKGDGPDAKIINFKSANFTDPKWWSHETDGSLFWKMSEGRNSMPSWKEVLSETERWQLVNYMRKLSDDANQ